MGVSGINGREVLTVCGHGHQGANQRCTSSFSPCQCHLRPNQPAALGCQPRDAACKPGSHHRHCHQCLATHCSMPGGALLFQKKDPVLTAPLDLLPRLGLSSFTRIPELSLMLFSASRSPLQPLPNSLNH